MNETIQALLDRRAVRAYEKKPVSKEDLELIVRCGQYAATAMGLQPWHFTIVNDRKLLSAIAEANRQAMLADPNTPAPVLEMAKDPAFDSFRGAPAAIIVSGETDSQYAVPDCANATENMAIAATALGLGSCYLASFKIAMLTPGGAHLKDAIGIPAGYTPQFALSVGYAAEHPSPAPRKPGSVNYIG